MNKCQMLLVVSFHWLKSLNWVILGQFKDRILLINKFNHRITNNKLYNYNSNKKEELYNKKTYNWIKYLKNWAYHQINLY